MRVRFLHLISILVALALPASAQGPLLVIIGTPAVGKTTQAEILHRDFGVTIISADDLIARYPEKIGRYKNPTLTGVEPRLDPGLNALVEQEFQKADLTKGVVFDGYPASAMQGEFLVNLRKKMKLPPGLVIHLQIPDAEARKRLTQQEATHTDIDQQLKDYHREFDFAKTYFPQADIHTVNGMQSTEAVAAEIRKLLASRGFVKVK